MSRTFYDPAQAVGYDFEQKMLIVTITDKMADKMKADGWTVGHEKDVGHFVSVKLEE